MYVAAYLRHGLSLLVPIAVACSVYLYLYPFFGGCAFPLPAGSSDDAFAVTKQLHWPYSITAGDDVKGVEGLPTKRAPFRLLALGDPQLEGDTSIPTKILGTFPHVKRILKRATFKTRHDSFSDRIRMILHDTIDVYFEDLPYFLESWRKRFDLFGNDFYLAHIYRTVHWWTRPSHVTVLGDLLGSQWIEDDEFQRRGWRFWKRTFRGGERVPDDVASWPVKNYTVDGYLDGSPAEEVWTRRIMNVAGNHDIGYAGDLTEERMDRFERLFGKANYEVRFELPITDPELNATMITNDPESKRVKPEIRILVINDMNLDTPAKSVPLQDQTYDFINTAIGASADVKKNGVMTVILTHIPMYKPKGVCVDAPFFDFHTKEDGGGVKEQYLLSADASKGFLEGIFGISKNPRAWGKGLGRQGLVLNGHDHAGCDTYHWVNQTNGTDAEDRSWEVTTWLNATDRGIPGMAQHPGRREITVRSMMGDFGGNAGLLSMWFNTETWLWEHEYTECPLGTQHFWWLAHILDFAALFFGVLYAVTAVLEKKGVDVDKLLCRVGCGALRAVRVAKRLIFGQSRFGAVEQVKGDKGKGKAKS